MDRPTRARGLSRFWARLFGGAGNPSDPGQRYAAGIAAKFQAAYRLRVRRVFLGVGPLLPTGYAGNRTILGGAPLRSGPCRKPSVSRMKRRALTGTAISSQ
jgi:hypothetical protein